jgi:hypothetical protein
MITIWMDGYFAVMVVVNQKNFLDTFASLDEDANLHKLINLRWLITCLIVRDKC